MSLKAKPKPPISVNDDGNIVIHNHRAPEPKRGAMDTRYEYRLSIGKDKYWTGPGGANWPRKGNPKFNKAGQKWSSLSRTLALWSEYNLSREIQNADWPDLTLEKFEISVKKVEAEKETPADSSRLASWYTKHERYSPLLSHVERLLKTGYDFKYILEYMGEGDELPTHLKANIHISKRHSYSVSTEGNYITVALPDDASMVFARVTLGDEVETIHDAMGAIVHRK